MSRVVALWAGVSNVTVHIVRHGSSVFYLKSSTENDQNRMFNAVSTQTNLLRM